MAPDVRRGGRDDPEAAEAKACWLWGRVHSEQTAWVNTHSLCLSFLLRKGMIIKTVHSRGLFPGQRK